MLNLSNICTYKNRYDFVWSGRLTFPEEISGAKFIDGWIRVPAAGQPGDLVAYSLEQTYSTTTTFTHDWAKSGNAVVANDGFIEPLDSQEPREIIVARFNAKISSAQDRQEAQIRDTGSNSIITGAYFKLRIGAENYSVADLTISDTLRDNPITIAWSVSAQTIQAIEIVNSTGQVVYRSTLSTATPGLTIPAGTLDKGTYTLRVQSGYDLSSGLHNEGVGVTTAIQTMPLTIWRVEPKIIAFEPDSVAQNRENPIAVTWLSENQQNYVLKVKQGGVAVVEYTGTTGTVETIPANTLASGLAQLELTLKYTPTWGTEADALYTTETIGFTAFGTPPLPVITTADTVDTAFPIITWASSEQYYFRLKILSGETVLQDTGEVPSELQGYTLTKPLDNGTYTVKLTVKNQYGLYSAEASKTLVVSCVLPQKPEIYCSGNDENGSISIKVINTDTGNFKHCDLFRRQGDDWVRIAKEQPTIFECTDYLVRSDAPYEYKARAIGLTSGYRDSDAKRAQAFVAPTQLFEPAKPLEAINLRLEPDREETAHRSVHFMVYAGMQAPTIEFGEEQYSTVAASFFVRAEDGERLKQLYFTASTLCYRDNRGRFLYGFISSDPVIKDSAWGWCAVKFDFTQTHYTEGI